MRAAPRLLVPLAVSLAAHASLGLLPGRWFGEAPVRTAPGSGAVLVALVEDGGGGEPASVVPGPSAASAPMAPLPEPEDEAAAGGETPEIEVVTSPAGGPAVDGGEGGPGPDGSGGAGSGGTGPGGGGSGGGGGDAHATHPPRLLAGALPLSPEDLGPLGAPREIEVRVLVGTDGKVLRAEPKTPGLSGEIRRAIDRSAAAMRFVPARRDGVAVEAWFTVFFGFRSS